MPPTTPRIPSLGSLTITNPAPGTLSGPLTSIDGVAPVGAVVYVAIDGSDDVQAVMGPDGHWSLRVPQPPPGAHTVRAQTSDDSVSVLFTAPSFSQPRQLPKPMPRPIGQPAPPAPEQPVEAPTLSITTPVPGSTVDTAKVIGGMAVPGASVSITIDGNAAQARMATAGPDGAWSISSSAGLAPGTHSIVANAGGATVTISVTVRAVDVQTEKGIPDWVWYGGAGLIALWGVWRMWSKKTAQIEARNNPGEQPSLKLQTIIVSKERASSKSEARDVAASFARNAPLPAADETGRSFRFRQREPSDFVPGSFVTIHPTPGVSLVLGHLR